MASAVECAKHIGLSERRFRELLDTETITRAPLRGYDLDVVREEYIAHLRVIASGRSLDLTEERARLAQAQAEKTELEVMEKKGELVRVSDIEKRWNGMGASLRTNLLSIPAKSAPRCEGKTVAEIETAMRNEINAALERISQPTGP